MEETRNDQTEATTPANTDKPTLAELVKDLQAQDKDVTVHIAPNGEATIVPSAGPPISDEPPSAEPRPLITTDELAQLAYAKIAEELKFKGDFPAWENVSDRGRGLYVEATAHVQAGNPPRTRFEEIVLELIAGPNTE
jgi:hypothetical protein